VSDGLFNVGLGSQTAGGIPTTVWNGDRYLEISVDGEALAPREMIRSVPIAGMALTVPDGSIGTAQLAENAVINAETLTTGPGVPHFETNVSTFTDIPGYEITLETNGGPVMIILQAPIASRAENGRVYLDFTVDGNSVSGAPQGVTQIVSSKNGLAEPGTTIWIEDVPAGIHTFKAQWRSSDGNIFINHQYYATQFSVIELKR
jgi:hypothetical protein